MSSKKSLLTESEMRRFMTLANIPVLGKETVKENAEVFEMDNGARQAQAEAYPQEAVETEEEVMDTSGLEGGEEKGAGGGDDEELKNLLGALKAALKPELASQLEIEDDSAGEESEEMPAPSDEEGEEGEEDEESEESEEDEGEGEADEEDEGMMEAKEPCPDCKKHKCECEGKEEEGKKLEESKLVDAVLARVTARLVSEAKKKKMSAAEKMKKMKAMKAAKEKKKKLEEANAPAPKATSSNGPKKGAGSATKGTFGVTSKVHDQEWGKTGKGDHEMETVSASADHTTSHGKKNLAVQGGNKKK